MAKLVATGTIRRGDTGRPVARFAAVPKDDVRDKGKVRQAAMSKTLAEADKRYKGKK